MTGDSGKAFDPGYLKVFLTLAPTPCTEFPTPRPKSCLSGNWKSLSGPFGSGNSVSRRRI